MSVLGLAADLKSALGAASWLSMSRKGTNANCSWACMQRVHTRVSAGWQVCGRNTRHTCSRLVACASPVSSRSLLPWSPVSVLALQRAPAACSLTHASPHCTTHRQAREPWRHAHRCQKRLQSSRPPCPVSASQTLRRHARVRVQAHQPTCINRHASPRCAASPGHVCAPLPIAHRNARPEADTRARRAHRTHRPPLFLAAALASATAAADGTNTSLFFSVFPSPGLAGWPLASSLPPLASSLPPLASSLASAECGARAGCAPSAGALTAGVDAAGVDASARLSVTAKARLRTHAKAH